MQPARIKYSCKGRLDLTIPIYSVAFHCLSRVICWKHLIRGASHKHTEPDVLACLSAFRARLAIYWPFFKNSAAYATQYCIQLSISRKVVGKNTRDNPERYCGCFWVHCFSKKFQRMAREAVDVCLRVVKKSSKSSVWQLQCQEKCIDHIPYYLSGLSRAQFFRQPFSK